MALRTSVGTGAWSVAGTWDTGVPVDGDTFAIAAGHNVTFDVDQSAMGSGMGASSIAATGTLTVKDDAGTYYLKMNGDLTLNGTFQAGTSIAVPLTSTFGLGFNGGSNSIVGSSTGRIYWYMTQPTNQFVRLADTEPAAETEMDNLTTDLTADIWAASDTVQIIDDVAGGSIDTESQTINAIVATKVTLNAGLGAEKTSGAWMVLLTRNIYVENGTDYAFKSVDSSAISCSITTSSGMYQCDSTTFTGCVSACAVTTIAGCEGSTFDSCVFCGADASNYGINGDVGSNIYTDCYFLGCRNCVYGTIGDIFNTCTFSAAYATDQNTNCAFNDCTFDQISSNFPTGANNVFSGCAFTNMPYGINQANGNLFVNCTTTNITNFIYLGYNNILYDCDLSGATTENNGYDNARATPYTYTESIDHDQVENAYKAWTRGGVVTSQTASPPTGYTIWYELACEDITQSYPCFRQYKTTVLPGTAIEVTGQIRIADGEDLSTAGLEPQLQIIDAFADPLVDSTNSVLDSDMPADVSGATTTWQDVSVIWANAGDTPRQVIVRMIAYNDGGADTVDVDTVWSIASYQDQIATLYNVLIPIKTTVATADTTTSFTLTAGQATADVYNNMTLLVQDAGDSHWELRSISDWTAGRVITVDTAFGFTPAAGDAAYIMATSYGAPVDLTSITNKLPTNYIMGSSDQNDHDTDIDSILVDTGTTLPATLTTMEGKIDTVDGNVDTILVDTNEVQAELADGGRLDLLIDAILTDTGTTLPAQISALNNITADDVHDEVIEGTITFRQAVRLLLSVMTGKSSGGGTTTISFRDIADSKNRLSVTVDSSGNRTAVGTRDGT